MTTIPAVIRGQPRSRIGTLLVLALACGPPVSACPYSIRDSAFISGTAASPYQLRLLVSGEGAAPGSASKDRIAEWLSAGATAWLDEANVEASVLDVSDPAARGSLPEGFTVPSALPVAILVSPLGAAMTLPEITPAGLSLDSVMRSALGVVESPLRRGIQRRLATSWCVVLLVEGDDADESARARQAFEVAARSITGRTTEMGKTVTRGPELLTVAYGDPAEKVLLWSLGLETSAQENVPVRAVLLVGRGERRGPVLEGDRVTSKELFDLFTMLGRSCSCTTDETWLSGPSLPLEWSAEIEALVRSELGFDPSRPEALGAIRGVRDGSAATPFSEATLGYTETFLELELGETPPISMTDPFRDAAAASIEAIAGAAASPEGAAAPKSLESGAIVSPPSEAAAAAARESARRGLGALVALWGTTFLVLAVATLIVLRRRPA